MVYSILTSHKNIAIYASAQDSETDELPWIVSAGSIATQQKVILTVGDINFRFYRQLVRKKVLKNQCNITVKYREHFHTYYKNFQLTDVHLVSFVKLNDDVSERR